MQPCESVFISQTRKLSHRELKSLAQGHTLGISITEPSLALEFVQREKLKYRNDRPAELMLNS